MSKDKKKDKLDNNMENISKKIESILQKRVLDITDKYKGKTRKGGYSVYLGYPQEMIEDLTKTIESERERVIGEMEKALVDSFPAFPNEKTKQMIKMFNSFWKLALKKINKLKKKG